MTFNVKVNPNPETRIVAKVTNNGGILQPATPITMKNQLREYQINSIEDLPDVSETEVVNGATLVYNANTDLYEVKPIDTTFLTGVIDAGEF